MAESSFGFLYNLDGACLRLFDDLCVQGTYRVYLAYFLHRNPPSTFNALLPVGLEEIEIFQEKIRSSHEKYERPRRKQESGV